MEDSGGDVGEACGAHHIGEEERGVEVYVEVGERLVYQRPVFDYEMVWGEGVVVGVRVVVDFLELEPAAWFQVTFRKLVLSGIITKGACSRA